MPILFRFHSDARHYALAPIALQADRLLQFAAHVPVRMLNGAEPVLA